MDALTIYHTQKPVALVEKDLLRFLLMKQEQPQHKENLNFYTITKLLKKYVMQIQLMKMMRFII
jgi:hypothetical protein